MKLDGKEDKGGRLKGANLDTRKNDAYYETAPVF